MNRLIFYMAIGWILGGCSVKSVPPVDEYLLNPTIQSSAHNAKKCSAKKLKLLAVFAPYKYTTNAMHYIRTAFTIDSYTALATG